VTNRRRLPDLWRRSSVTVRDLPLALLIFGVSFVPALYDLGTQLGGMPPRAFDVWAVVAAALQGLPLTVRRRAPAACLVLVSVGFALDQLRGYHLVAGTALPIALLSAGSHLERHRRAAALVLSTAYVLLSLALHRLGGDEAAEGYVLFYLTLVLACGAGVWLRSTRAAEAERRRRVAEDTLAAERARIARELHDVVTHHVTAMVVQCEAARYLTAAPERLDETLAAVSDTGRRAITDLRHLLDLLNPGHGAGAGAPGDRTPAVGELRALVEQTREAGQPVEFTEEGTPAASTGSADLVAYRVVQEALTNALKYAHGIPTRVRVHHSVREITVEVGTDATGSPTASLGGSGRGLEGLRRRVALLGGDFSAGPGEGGGFTVLARIPAGSPS
jgi:signal transduction histidine kinase